MKASLCFYVQAVVVEPGPKRKQRDAVKHYEKAMTVQRRWYSAGYDSGTKIVNLFVRSNSKIKNDNVIQFKWSNGDIVAL